MTRPDPRLLAPLWRQPCVPDGACAWSGDRRIITNGFTGTDALILELYLDLSAPALRDGIPERLDALPWALAVLGWGDGYTTTRYGGFTDLTPDEAQRAVVAAALRGAS
jgi:hypothetical protein